MLNSKISQTQVEENSHEIKYENLVPEKFEYSSESSEETNRKDAETYSKFI